MRALTVSELNAILIEKGYNGGYGVDLEPDENKWGATNICFSEDPEGKSYCGLYKKAGICSLVRVASYTKLKAVDKKEFRVIVDALPKVN